MHSDRSDTFTLQSSIHSSTPRAKPILKWAGGKTQLLDELLARMPRSYGRYIEPFVGGGALFFAVAPDNGVIADSNPELINLYKTVANNVEGVIDALRQFRNEEAQFYATRALDWKSLPEADAAARTLYLNRCCFNGLYRVNRSGQFNVPFGHYKNPKLLDIEGLHAASQILRKTDILCGDYKEVLQETAKAGDFIFLDPPYLPVSAYSDFKRYTKEQFYEEDHVELAAEIMRLHELGCTVLLTNSNHPLVHEQYRDYKIEVVKTRRHISSKASARSGEDVIVNIPPKQRLNLRLVPQPLPAQALKYPSTRYMGSKNKLLPDLWAVASQFKFSSAVDLFAGSGVVGYLLKSHGKNVLSNDYMAMSGTFAKAMIENNTVTLPLSEARALTEPDRETDHFVQTTFAGLYFSEEDNQLIDVIRANIKAIRNPYKRAIAMSALIRACLKKRPRGIFTYVGHRYNDGRRDLMMPFRDQFMEAVQAINDAVFDNGQTNKARVGDALSLNIRGTDLVYIDPPYYSPLSDNEYVRRYHFVEGLARDWQGVEIQPHTRTKKFKSYPTPFSSRKGAAEAFDLLFRKFRDSILLVSYSSNSQPTLDEMVAMIAKYKKRVEVIPVDYRYSFGNQAHKVNDNRNAVKEYIFAGF